VDTEGLGLGLGLLLGLGMDESVYNNNTLEWWTPGMVSKLLNFCQRKYSNASG